jgi:hypothetical protein
MRSIAVTLVLAGAAAFAASAHAADLAPTLSPAPSYGVGPAPSYGVGPQVVAPPALVAPPAVTVVPGPIGPPPYGNVPPAPIGPPRYGVFPQGPVGPPVAVAPGPPGLPPAANCAPAWRCDYRGCGWRPDCGSAPYSGPYATPDANLAPGPYGPPGPDVYSENDPAPGYYPGPNGPYAEHPPYGGNYYPR